MFLLYSLEVPPTPYFPEEREWTAANHFFPKVQHSHLSYNKFLAFWIVKAEPIFQYPLSFVFWGKRGAVFWTGICQCEGGHMQPQVA